MYCPKKWKSDHTCHHPHRFNELATKSEKWKWKPRLACVSVHLPPWQTPVDVLPWTCRSQGKWPSRETDGQGNPHKWLASRKIWSIKEPETAPAGTKPRTSITDRLEQKGIERGSAGRSSLTKTRKGHGQSDQGWTYFKGDTGKTGRNAYGLFGVENLPSWTELNTTITTNKLKRKRKQSKTMTTAVLKKNI